MGNLADNIEQFILHKLSGEDSDIIILRRNELAEEIDCAPSQVSYVLNTRFTTARGYIVESRRGSGGFVRIARIPLQKFIYEDAAQQIDHKTSPDEVVELIRQLSSHGLLTKREAKLISTFCRLICSTVEPAERALVMRALMLSLADL